MVDQHTEYLEEEAKLHLIKQSGYSDFFIDLIKFADKNSCWWINLDCDGEYVEGLEYNEW